MALHYDFPYTVSQLYCKSCKNVTTHNWMAAYYKCSMCGSEWSNELIRVSLKQDQYGELSYECIILSDKPVNSTTYPSKRFKNLEACLEWLRENAVSLEKEIKS